MTREGELRMQRTDCTTRTGGGGRCRDRRCERGSALVAMLFVTLTLAAVSMAYVTVVPTSLRATRDRTALMRARYWALEGAARAQRGLQTGQATNLDGNAMTGQVVAVAGDDDAFADLREEPNGTFRVRTSALPEQDTHLIESAAVMHGIVQRVAQVVRRRAVSPYSHAAFGVGSVDYGGVNDLLSDSYDSTQGSYQSQSKLEQTMPNGKTYRYASARGAIGSDGSVRLPNGAIFGDVRPGPTGIFGPSEHTYVTGSTVPTAVGRELAPPTWTVPTVTNNHHGSVASLINSSGGLVLSNGAEVTVPEGDYVVNSLSVFWGRIDVQGHVRLYVRGPFYVGLFGQMRIRSGATLEVFVDSTESVRTYNSGVRNQSGSGPSRFRVYAAADPNGGGGAGPLVEIAQTVPFEGVVYAPRSPVYVSAPSVEGAIVGDFVGLSGQEQRFSFDRSLERLEDVAPRVTRYENVATWWLTR